MGHASMRHARVRDNEVDKENMMGLYLVQNSPWPESGKVASMELSFFFLFSGFSGIA